jgi:hypothetical protein
MTSASFRCKDNKIGKRSGQVIMDNDVITISFDSDLPDETVRYYGDVQNAFDTLVKSLNGEW